MADVKPDVKPGPTSKGAEVQMGEPGTPSGPNETEDGIIKLPPIEPPGEDQIGLIGGDPGEPLQSTPPYEEVPPDPPVARQAAKAKAVSEKSDR